MLSVSFGLHGLISHSEGWGNKKLKSVPNSDVIRFENSFLVFKCVKERERERETDASVIMVTMLFAGPLPSSIVPS
jgi:hypothetical protein